MGILEQHKRPLQEALTLTLSSKKSNEKHEAVSDLSTLRKLEMGFVGSLTSNRTMGLSEEVAEYSVMKCFSEVSLYHDLQTDLKRKRDLTGTLARIRRMTSDGRISIDESAELIGSRGVEE